MQSRPDDVQIIFKVQADQPVEFTLKLRRPWWLKSELKCTVNGQAVAWVEDGSGFASVRRTWQDDEIRVILTKGLTCWPLPDRPNTVAFLDGPIVLAGLVGEDRMLFGDIADPSSMLVPDEEREWQTWKNSWRTVDQPSRMAISNRCMKLAMKPIRFTFRSGRQPARESSTGSEKFTFSDFLDRP